MHTSPHICAQIHCLLSCYNRRTALFPIKSQPTLPPVFRVLLSLTFSQATASTAFLYYRTVFMCIQTRAHVTHPKNPLSILFPPPVNAPTSLISFTGKTLTGLVCNHSLHALSSHSLFNKLQLRFHFTAPLKPPSSSAQHPVVTFQSSCCWISLSST